MSLLNVLVIVTANNGTFLISLDVYQS